MSREVSAGWDFTDFNNIASDVSIRNRGRDQIPVLSVTKYNGFVPSEEYFQKKVFSADTENYKIVRKGQFAYATIHLDEGSIDRLTRFDAGLISPMYTVFEIDERQADPDFILRLLKLYAMKGHFDALGNGGVNRRKSISFSTLGKLSIPLPPLHEQRRIAEILSSVDEAIAATRAVIEQTRKVKQGVLERLLTKGIGHTRFKQTEIGEIPEGWKVVELIDASNAVTVGIASSATHAYRADGIPMLRNQNIKAGILDLSDLLFVSPEYDAENASKRVKTGDVVSMRTGYPGRSAVIPPELDGCQTFTTLVTKPKQSLMNSDFLCAWINSDGGMKQVRRLQAGGAQQNLNAGMLKKLLVPLPPLPEQQQIALSAQDLLFDEEQGIGALIGLKSALMSDLLTGRRRVTDALPMAAE
ncbi:restriction endonuclease subunit S [Rhizobium sp. NFR12]|uniref:restriction endonuclease subunit S n=1 Tax=Rhizobium sp. NFR12 TaxID=1566261 RepID=UPI0008A73EAB|nr:restriction endonuclease subunit S [Rhizobium sp. NFR12]SEH23587.1 Restriction endonuclease S subunit [Rhizobium sp. NFR12]